MTRFYLLFFSTFTLFCSTPHATEPALDSAKKNPPLPGVLSRAEGSSSRKEASSIVQSEKTIKAYLSSGNLNADETFRSAVAQRHEACKATKPACLANVTWLQEFCASNSSSLTKELTEHLASLADKEEDLRQLLRLQDLCVQPSLGRLSLLEAISRSVGDKKMSSVAPLVLLASGNLLKLNSQHQNSVLAIIAEQTSLILSKRPIGLKFLSGFYLATTPTIQSVEPEKASALKNWLSDARSILSFAGSTKHSFNFAQKFPVAFRKQSPDWDIELSLYECEYWQLYGKIDICLSKLDLLLTSDAGKKSAGLRIRRALALLEKGDSSSAQKLTQELLQQTPPSEGATPWLFFLSSKISLSLGNHSSALASLSSFEKYFPQQNSPPFYYVTAQLYAQLLKLRLHREVGKFSEVEALSQKIESTLAILSSDSNMLLAEHTFEQFLFAATKKDLVKQQFLYKKLTLLSGECPDAIYFVNLAEPLALLSLNKDASGALALLKRKLGERHPDIVRIELLLKNLKTPPAAKGA